MQAGGRGRIQAGAYRRAHTCRRRRTHRADSTSVLQCDSWQIGTCLDLVDVSICRALVANFFYMSSFSRRIYMSSFSRRYAQKVDDI